MINSMKTHSHYARNRKLRAMRRPLKLLLVFCGIVLILMAAGASLRSTILSSPEPTPTPTPDEGIIALNGWYLDARGRVTSRKPPTPVPTLNARTDPLRAGLTVSGDAIETTLGVLGELSRTPLAVTQVTIYNDSYIELLLEDGTKMLFTSTRTPYDIRTTLQSIHTAYTMEGRVLDRIDYRYSKPLGVERTN
jgi:hypothetical protein